MENDCITDRPKSTPVIGNMSHGSMYWETSIPLRYGKSIKNGVSLSWRMCFFRKSGIFLWRGHFLPKRVWSRKITAHFACRGFYLHYLSSTTSPIGFYPHYHLRLLPTYWGGGGGGGWLENEVNRSIKPYITWIVACEARIIHTRVSEEYNGECQRAEILYIVSSNTLITLNRHPHTLNTLYRVPLTLSAYFSVTPIHCTLYLTP